MKALKCSLILPFILCLAQITVLENRAFAAVPLQVRVNVNSFPTSKIPQQIELLKRLESLFKDNQVKAGFWFSGSAYQLLTAREPELVKSLLDGGFLVGHHGANRGGKGNTPVDRVSGMDWGKAVAWARDYEQSPIGGGLAQMQQDLDGQVKVTGRFFRAPLLQATKELGCEAMVGLKGQLKAPSNAAWYMGMFNLPDRVDITPDKIRQNISASKSLYQQIDTSISQWPDNSLETVSILVHDRDFLRGPPADQRKFWSLYEDLILWAANHPELETVSYDDLRERVIDDRSQVLESSMLLAAVRALLEQGELPLHISVENTYLSLADLFYALSSALTTYRDTGKLPGDVAVEGLLGPVGMYNMDQKANANVTSREVISSIHSWFNAGYDIVPTSLQVKNVQADSAALLFAMAEIFDSLYRSGTVSPQVQLRSMSVFPAQTEKCRDVLSRLQFWTYKPQRPIWEGETAQVADKTGNSSSTGQRRTPVYVTFYAHNEEGAPWDRFPAEPELYNEYRSDLIRKIQLLHDNGAALSWQADHTVLRAMLDYEKGTLLETTNNKNILRWMVEDMGVEVAPHGHLTQYNYADLVYLINELGVTPAPVVGGFILYRCGGNDRSASSTPIAEIDWIKHLEISTDGTISGRKYPGFTWQPEILALPAMYHHLFDEYSSGVWQVGATGGFTVHDPGGQFITIGQGYPHYAQSLRLRDANGTPVNWSPVDYIKELVDNIQANPDLQGLIFTASIYIRDYPTEGRTGIYERLERSLAELAPLVQERSVIFANYQEVAGIWNKDYQGIANRFPIEESSLFPVLEQNVNTRCMEKSGPGNKRGSGQGKCGDGVCDDVEKRTGMCEADCTGQKGTGTMSSGGGSSRNHCGDGICDDFEKRTGMCETDCSGQTNTGPENRGGGRNRNLCGDGICDDQEKRTGRCETDCSSQNPTDRNDQNSDKNYRLCGDGTCDEIERMSGKCPQDCDQL